MEIELITKADFHSLKSEIVDEIKRLFQSPVEQKEWLKSSDVMKMLDCSPGTLQNLRVNGTLPFTKMGGTIYYSSKDVMKVLNDNKQNAA
ncbi:DNA-binding protein [Terrimonas sp.]|uniref:helix-turn-helix domain-containing protein n=1 Tax=Terrimonas sp. TaxID=1914338 RepID=UPI000D508275|nr:helix-turn-helix domain-containing protein [Terrimonas sp.]PVD53599.1 DNA-binding protein [Terrimonas sp.]